MKKKKFRNAELARQTNILKRACVDESHDIQEVTQFKTCLKGELRNEARLKDEIHKICSKYKKLLLDQKKEKEKAN